MPTWRLEKEFKFEASHKLPYHDGKCARLHGHSWKGRVIIITRRGSSLVQSGPKQGMVMDYSDLKSIVKPLVEDYLDHHHLNDTLQLESPTSEAIAQWIWRRLRPQFDSTFDLIVEVEETCTSRCQYTESVNRRTAVL